MQSSLQSLLVVDNTPLFYCLDLAHSQTLWNLWTEWIDAKRLPVFNHINERLQCLGLGFGLLVKKMNPMRSILHPVPTPSDPKGLTISRNCDNE